MLQFFNNKISGFLKWIIIIFVGLIFIITGSSSFLSSILVRGDNSYVVKVGDNNKITKQELIANMQGNMNILQRQVTLNALVNRDLGLADAQNHKVELSKLALQAAIFKYPSFLDKDGEFSTHKFEDIAKSIGGVQNVVNFFTNTIMTNIIPSNLKDTNFLTTYEKTTFKDVYFVNKDIKYIKIQPKDLQKQVKPTPQQLQNSYQSSKSSYVIPAKKSINYFIISSDDFNSKGKITEQEIQNYYNKNKSLFSKFDDKSKKAIKKIIQNSQSIKKYESYTKNINSIKFSQLEQKLGKAKTTEVTNNSEKDIKGARSVEGSKLFSNNDKYSSIKLPNNKTLVYQVTKTIASKQQDFDEVKDKVTKSYIKQQSKILANKQASQLLKDLNKGKDTKRKFSMATVSSENKHFPKKFVDYVISNNNSEYHNYKDPNGDSYIYKVTKVEKPKENSKKEKLSKDVISGYKRAEHNFYIGQLRKSIPMKFNTKLLNSIKLDNMFQ